MRMFRRMLLGGSTVRTRKMGVYNSYSMDDMTMSKKSYIGKVAQKKSQEKYPDTDVFFYFIHFAHLKRDAKVINYFE